MKLLTALLAAASCYAADFNGTWLGRIADKEDIAFSFVQKGPVLTGKLYGDYQSTPILKGTVSGDLITFLLIKQEQAGNEIHETHIRFTGRIVDNEIELMRERESSTRAGSGAAVTYRNNPRQTFKLQRLP